MFRRKKNKVFSLKLRNNKFVLMQIINDIHFNVAVFKEFRDKDEWGDITLTKNDVLFLAMVTRDVYRFSEIKVHKNVKPVEGLIYKESLIHMGNGFRKIKVFEGTDMEMEMNWIGSSDQLELLKWDPEMGNNGDYISEPLTLDDYERVKHLEMGIQIWPLLNERLYIISELGLDYNYSAYREVAFERPLHPICKVWVDINNGNKEVYLDEEDE